MNKDIVRISGVALAIFCLMDLGMAAAPDHNGMVRIAVTPRCKKEWIPPPPFSSEITKKERPSSPGYEWWDPTSAKPMTYKDPRTSVSIYVESDGRHIAAIAPNGKLLWVRNPFEEAHLCPYRNGRPVIARLEAIELDELHAKNLKGRGADLSHNFLAIQFDSSQYGVIDESSGDFIAEGRD